MFELVKGYKLAAFDFGPAAADGGELSFGRGVDSIPALEVLAPRFAQKL
jgi:hypothetical protein